MGIRYYAYPLAPEFVDRAKEDPHLFMSDDPLADAWNRLDPASMDMLYLDKCWSLLQLLTRPESGPSRTAFQLFEGDVTHVYEQCAWIPWIKVLPPDTVDAVATDLALFDESDVTAFLARDDIYLADYERDHDYILLFLRRAQAFSAHLQQQGWGLIYMIG